MHDGNGRPPPGFALDDMEPLFGDELDAAISWKAGRDLSRLAGGSVQFRSELRDTGLFAMRVAR